jgi:hypothetical protein
MFRLKDGTFMTNERGKVIEVSGGKDNENQNIVVNNKNGKVEQRWKIIYADEYPREPIKGELNKKFGLYVERPFYIISALKSNRYLDLINNRNMVIKTANGNKGQTFYFHQQSKTVRSRINNQSWDIRSSGKTADLQIWSTNAGWF